MNERTTAAWEDPKAVREALSDAGAGDLAGRRWARVTSETHETDVEVLLDLDGPRHAENQTGVAFFDHMLDQLGFHAGWFLSVSCSGDTDVDDHHTVEDVGLALGSALADALGKGVTCARFGSAYAPLDEALARVVVDVSGRPFFAGELGLRRDRVGALSCDMVPHFFHSFAQRSNLTIHVDVLRGANDHHRIEAAFKALALALRAALAAGESEDVPSTKGVL